MFLCCAYVFSLCLYVSTLQPTSFEFEVGSCNLCVSSKCICLGLFTLNFCRSYGPLFSFDYFPFIKAMSL